MINLSLSKRVKITFLLSFILFSIVSTIMIYAASKGVEDHIFEIQLNQYMSQYTQAIDNDQRPLLQQNIRVYNKKEQIPTFISNYILEEKSGVYEIDHPDDFDYHYGVTYSAKGQQYFFVFDVNTIELSEGMEQVIVDFVLFCFLIMLVLFLFLFNKTIKTALSPMYNLIEQVKKQTEHPDKPLNYRYPQDNELGLLGKTFTDYSERLQDYIHREREFSGFASHELRTPVTIIKGAIEVAQLQPENAKLVNKSLQRISRAAQTMEDTIETLLILAKDQKIAETKVASLASILTNVLVNFEDKFKKHHKHLQITGQLSELENINQVAAEIVISNLIRNAIQHSDIDCIELSLTERSITIRNDLQSCEENKPLVGINASSAHPVLSIDEKGYGLGRVIIERVCKQHNWQVTEDILMNAYSVTIDFC